MVDPASETSDTLYNEAAISARLVRELVPDLEAPRESYAYQLILETLGDPKLAGRIPPSVVASLQLVIDISNKQFSLGDRSTEVIARAKLSAAGSLKMWNKLSNPTKEATDPAERTHQLEMALIGQRAKYMF